MNTIHTVRVAAVPWWSTPGSPHSAARLRRADRTVRASVRARWTADQAHRADLLPGAPPADQMRGNRAENCSDGASIESAGGRSRVEWTPTPAAGQPRRARCTAAILGLIVDDVCGMAFASLLTEFRAFPTMSMQLEFHRPIQIGETVECRGTVVRVGRRFVVVDAVVRRRRRQAARPGARPRSRPTSKASPWPTAGPSPASPHLDDSTELPM